VLAASLTLRADSHLAGQLVFLIFVTQEHGYSSLSHVSLLLEMY
jgi:hypothetical protein